MNGNVQSGGSNGDVLAQGRVTLGVFTAYDGLTGVYPLEMTNADGSFSFNPPSTTTRGIFYAVAKQASTTPMMTILGGELPENIVINELTTIAAIYCVAQFVDGLTIKGPSFSLRVASAMSTNVVNAGTGAPSQILVNSPNADQTNGLRLTASLANLLAWCVRDPDNCDALFDLTTSPSGTRPANLLEAVYNIAKYPANNVAAIYQQSLQVPQVYTPTLKSQPDAWTLAVKVNDSGDTNNMFGGPGNLVFDSKGRAWITNNVQQGSGTSTEYCIVLDAAARPATENGQKISPFTGGGLLGTGYGVALDSQENVWFGNFGWGGDDPSPTGSMSLFRSNADAVSPGKTSTSTGGYQTGNFHRVQGVAVDANDNVWIAGWKSHTVAVFTNVTKDDYGIQHPILYDPNDDSFDPFGIAIASDNTAWVVNANNQQSGLVQLQLDHVNRTLTAINTPQPFGKQAKGIAIDSAGNIWVASGRDGYVYAFRSDGTKIGQYNGGQIDGPWGVGIDGEDNVWVANFGALGFHGAFTGRLTQLVGANEATIPSGSNTGDVLSPPNTGYTVPNQGDEILLANNQPLYGDGGPTMYIPFMRVTALNIDAAGNIWCCNNWKPLFALDWFGDPLKDELPNPGGDGMVIFIGLAPPRRDAAAATRS